MHWITVTTEYEIPKDDAFHLLQNERRRAVMRYLLDHPDQDQFRMRTLAEEVAAWEHNTTVRELAADQRQRVYIGLYQSHLPKLDDYGVIKYDQARGTVEATPLLAVFQPYVGDGLHDARDGLSVSADAHKTEESRLTDTVTSLLSQ